jgi:hypothetical protein
MRHDIRVAGAHSREVTAAIPTGHLGQLIRRFETAKIVTFNNILVQRSSYSACSSLSELTTAQRQLGSVTSDLGRHGCCLHSPDQDMA